MPISTNVQRQFFRTASAPTSDDLIRIPPTVIMSHNIPQEVPRSPFIKTRRRLNIWTVEEHELFLRGLELHPRGPWKAIAAVVGTKTTRQTMTHAQKYRQKIRRMEAGQTIKIFRIPSDNEEDLDVNEERVAQDASFFDSMADDLDLGFDVHGVSHTLEVPSTLEQTFVPSGTPFHDWEMDALLAEMSQSLDIEIGDFIGDRN